MLMYGIPGSTDKDFIPVLATSSPADWRYTEASLQLLGLEMVSFPTKFDGSSRFDKRISLFRVVLVIWNSTPRMTVEILEALSILLDDVGVITGVIVPVTDEIGELAASVLSMLEVLEISAPPLCGGRLWETKPAVVVDAIIVASDDAVLDGESEIDPLMAVADTAVDRIVPVDSALG
jgi:hypothetical protein